MCSFRFSSARLVLAAGGTAAVIASGVAIPSAGLATDHAGGSATRRAVVAVTAGRPVPVAAAGRARPVFLINGDELQSGRGGSAIAVTRLPGSSGLLVMEAAGRAEAIPDDALPYLGRGLDPGLFDLTALRRAESGAGLPVRVTFTGRRPVLPGITVTRSGPGSELGYLTASGTARFGAALARQFRTAQAGAAHGLGGLFARGVRVALARARPAAAPPPRPGRRLWALTVKATGLAGSPVTGGMVAVFNADNLNAFYGHNQKVFHRGIATFRVPAGHYFALAFFSTARSVRNVVLPQFTVRHARTLRLSERAASSKISFTTSRPAALAETGFWADRRSARGGSEWFVSFAPGRVSQWVSPASARPTAGTLHTYTEGQLFSPPAAAGTPYVYNLDFASDGIIPSQHRVVRQASLAAVINRYYSAVPLRETWVTGGGYATQIEGVLDFGSYHYFTPPQAQVQYFSAGPSLVWGEQYGKLTYGWCCGETGADQTFRPGQRLTHDWNAYPLHPQPVVQLLHGSPAGQLVFRAFAAPYRTGNTLHLDSSPIPFSDNYPGDLGNDIQHVPGGRVTGSYAVYADGRRIARGNPVISPLPQVRISREPATIRLVLTMRETSPLLPLSPASQTTWTWRTRRDPSATIPPGWFCDTGPTGESRHCAVQPMMTLDYHVSGLSLHGTTRPGRQVISLNAGHVQLGGHARITRASARVCLDCNSGAWKQAQVTALGRGRFRITFTALAGVMVTLHVDAGDSAGGSITETIMRAYRIASS